MKGNLLLLGCVALALTACTNVEMDPYANGKRPTPAPVYGAESAPPIFDASDARVQSGNMPYIPAGGTTYVETVNIR